MHRPFRVSWLRTLNSSPSSLPLVSKAAPILYSTTAYLSNFPFHSPSVNGLKTNITYEALLRAIFWTIPGRSNRSFDRARSASDQRRLLFQSLADISRNFPFDISEEKEVARQRALDVADHDRDYAIVNYDNEGDEMYHDVLDIISTHRMQYIAPPYGTYSRKEFHPLAKRLASATNLRQLAISRSRFEILVRFLLAEHQYNELQKTDLQLLDIDSTANHVANAFCQGVEPGGVITWRKFESALTEKVPLLFDPLYRIFQSFIRTEETSANDFEAWPPETLPPSRLLNLTTINQICLSLGRSIGFGPDDRHSIQQVSTTTELYEAIGSCPRGLMDFQVVLLSGKAVADDAPVLFGVFIQGLGEFEEIAAREEGNERDGTFLFQLSPIQDVFCGTIGKKAWTYENGDLWFGQKGQGVAFGNLNGGKQLSVTHQAGEGTYQPTSWRGQWELEVEIEHTEIWTSIA